MVEPPALVFAYANDRADDDRYLRNLPEERRAIKAALRAATESRRCEAVECANATLEEVLDECQRRSSRLLLFHFAGHADGKTLLFEERGGQPAGAGASSIAEFLGAVPSLKLVVLNGCSTEAQVKALLERGVPAVVATGTAVADEVATRFAGRFYAALAEGETIQDAFDQASGAVRATLGASDEQAHRAATRGLAADRPAPDAWPWQIHGAAPARADRLISRPVGALRWLSTRAKILVPAVVLLAALGFAAYRYTHPPPLAWGLWNIQVELPARIAQRSAVELRVHSDHDGYLWVFSPQGDRAELYYPVKEDLELKHNQIKAGQWRPVPQQGVDLYGLSAGSADGQATEEQLIVIVTDSPDPNPALAHMAEIRPDLKTRPTIVRAGQWGATERRYQVVQ